MWKLFIFFIKNICKEILKYIQVKIFTKIVENKYYIISDIFKDDKAIITEKFDNFRNEIKSTISNNCYNITSNKNFKSNYINNNFYGGYVSQMALWIKYTKFFKSYDECSLNKYYNSLIGSNYCNFLKLNNKEWCLSRIKQFEYMEDIENKSYLEFGGTTGMLPAFAAYLGFKKVVNHEINIKDGEKFISFCDKLNLDNIAYKNTVDESNRYDYISTHMVLEHCYNKKSVIDKLFALLNEKGVLFISHDCDNIPYPGHIFELDFNFENYLTDKKIKYSKINKIVYKCEK